MLGRNERKQQQNHPDFSGQCEMEDGKQYWISGWIKESGPQSKTPGRKFFSLAFKPKDPPPKQAQPTTQQAAPAAQPKPQPAPKQANLDEDVPF